MCVSQSRFFIRSSLGVWTFCKGKDFEVPIRLFVLINDVFSSLDIEFQLSNFQISEEKLILTSAKFSEFDKKLQNLPQRHLDAKKQLFCSRIS